jgi:hypothetical protein
MFDAASLGNWDLDGTRWGGKCFIKRGNCACQSIASVVNLLPHLDAHRSVYWCARFGTIDGISFTKISDRNSHRLVGSAPIGTFPHMP